MVIAGHDLFNRRINPLLLGAIGECTSQEQGFLLGYMDGWNERTDSRHGGIKFTLAGGFIGVAPA